MYYKHTILYASGCESIDLSVIQHLNHLALITLVNMQSEPEQGIGFCLHNCYQAVTKLLPSCYQGLLPSCYQTVTKLLPRAVTKLLPNCYQSVTKLLPNCYQSVTKLLPCNLLPSCYQAVTKLLPICYQSVTKLLPSCYQAVTNLLPICYQTVTNISLRRHQHLWCYFLLFVIKRYLK